jgi:phosphoglycolate phosphatase
MKYKGILFDLDGTLADTLDDIAGSMNRVLLTHGYPVHQVDDYKLLVGRGLENLVAQSLPLHARQADTVRQCHQEMIRDYAQNCLVKTHLYEGIQNMLDSLIKKKVKLAVFSNKDEPITIQIVNQLLGDVQFLKIMGALPDFPKKPDPAGAIVISKLMNSSPEELIYMGDSDVDMITANRAGMFAVGVLWGFRSKEELLSNGAKALLNHPLELLNIIL